jgi:hypothetical protein
MSPSPFPLTPPDRRTDLRVATRIPAVVQTPDGIEIAAEITNLSRGGFRAQCTILLRKGTRVSVRLNNAIRQRRAQVVWQEGQEIGCRFQQPLPEELFAAAIGE